MATFAPDGTFTAFDPAGREVAGTYEDANQVFHGFWRSPDGTINSFDPLGTTGTYVSGLNSERVVVGNYLDSNQVDHGFILFPDGTVTTIDPRRSYNTGVAGVNDFGLIAGSYSAVAGRWSASFGYPRNTIVGLALRRPLEIIKTALGRRALSLRRSGARRRVID
jgi:hypothetical protein